MTTARILVVDDEVDINMILSVTLRRAGYEVISAADGLEALEVIHLHAPDLILLDVMMPRADGLEALRRIREHEPTAHTPVIMLTAKGALADKMKGFEHGADDYVAKPFEPAEILARVQALLKRTAQSRVVRPLLSVLGDWFTAEHMAQFGRDLEAARDIQRRLLPPVPARVAGLDAGAVLRSSTIVGGDFFDIFPMGERLGVVVGDVSGKGIPAALLMVMVRTLLREIARDLPAARGGAGPAERVALPGHAAVHVRDAGAGRARSGPARPRGARGRRPPGPGDHARGRPRGGGARSARRAAPCSACSPSPRSSRSSSAWPPPGTRSCC